METKNHLALARYLIETVDHPVLSHYKKAFLLGNISPDINLFSYIEGHRYENCNYKMHKIWCRLINKEHWNWYDVYELGRFTHYLADYFTYPHNKKYEGNLVAHYQYEKNLHPFFTAYLNRVAGIRPLELFFRKKKNELLQYIEAFHKEYVDRRTSLQDDCYYIVSISGGVLRSIYV